MADSTNSIYLSRLHLNPLSRQVMNELAHPYEMHRTLMRAFPQATDANKSSARGEFGVLFRAENDALRNAVRVYVQSRPEPDWSCLYKMDEYLCTDPDLVPSECKDIMPALRRLQVGQHLFFRMLANPTKRVGADGDPMKGKRVELRREDEQIEWLIRKGRGTGNGKSGGFELVTQVTNGEGEKQTIPRVSAYNQGRRTGKKRVAGQGHSTTHFAVLFEGLLRVTDTEDFIDTLVCGIGAGKGFGFGLLTLGPARMV